jgi:hypothetical protein
MTRSNQAFALLHAANPVPGMPSSRRRRSALKIALAVVALTVCFLLVAPAVGIRIPVIDFWSAEKAPPRIVQDFEELSQGAPPGMDPGAIPGEARKVLLADGTTLWVAPTKHGGFCTTGTVSGGCDKLGTWPLGVSWRASGPLRLVEQGRMRPPPMTAFDVLEGHANSRYVDSVEVRFADGEIDRPSLAWVSEPIHAGFFQYRVPLEHRRVGHEIRSVVGLDSEGRVVVVDAPRPSADEAKGIPVDAVVTERHARARISTREGVAVVWESPTRYEGRCAWLETDRGALPFVPCMAKGYDYGLFAIRFVPTRNDVLIVGAVAPHYARVEIQFADGTSMIVKPRAGFLLAEVPARHLVRGREATAIIGRDESGKELPPRISVKEAFALAPCFGPLPDPSCP